MNVNNTPATPSPDEAREQRLDDEFADLTDALLAGRDIRTTDELRDLAGTARQLQRLMGDDGVPSAAFRSRLSRRLDEEWTQTRQQRSILPFLAQRGPLSRRQLAQWGALAAALLIAVIATAYLVNQAAAPLQGSPLGLTPTPTFFIAFGLFVFGLAVVGVIAFGLRRRR